MKPSERRASGAARHADAPQLAKLTAALGWWLTANIKQGFCRVILVLPLVVAIARAEVPKHDELKGALADLTTNIEAADDAGFAKAARIMVNALSFGVAPSRIDFTADCVVWRPIPLTAVDSGDIVLFAFTAGVVQERVYGDPKMALYRGWLNVIKYYRP